MTNDDYSETKSLDAGVEGAASPSHAAAGATTQAVLERAKGRIAAIQAGKPGRRKAAPEPDLFSNAPASVPAIVATAQDVKPSKIARPTLDLKLIEKSALISDEAPSGSDITFMHAIMCQVGLPRSKVDGTSFERKCGNAALSVTAGKLWNGADFVQQPVPYGPLPRLMLAWMNTYAVRHKTPEIPVGNSEAEFMTVLGKDTSGGARGGYAMFRKQMQALSACSLTLGFTAGGKAYTYDGKPVGQFEAWIGKDGPGLWPGVVTYSAEYFQTLSDHAVPVDVRAYFALKGSSLAMDIYMMLADRLHRISGRPVVLYWANLLEQFGGEYKGKDPKKDFSKKFLPALRDVLAVYPTAKVKVVTGGILLYPSAPPIPYKPA